MTRFDAATPIERAQLYAAAVMAHREREGSPFLTFEADHGERDEWPLGVPWVQVTVNVVSLDCTDEELERVKTLVNDYPSFRIEDLTSPEDAEGTNVRISARADANRIAGFVDEVFQEVYDLPEDYRGWVVEL